MRLEASHNITCDIIDDFEFDYDGIKLFGVETDTVEDDERPYSFDGETIFYHTSKIRTVGFDVEGFTLNDSGACITCAFAKPVTLFTETNDEDMNRIELDYNEGSLADAIKSKLGNILWVKENMQ